MICRDEMEKEKLLALSFPSPEKKKKKIKKAKDHPVHETPVKVGLRKIDIRNITPIYREIISVTWTRAPRTLAKSFTIRLSHPLSFSKNKNKMWKK